MHALHLAWLWHGAVGGFIGYCIGWRASTAKHAHDFIIRRD